MADNTGPDNIGPDGYLMTRTNLQCGACVAGRHNACFSDDCATNCFCGGPTPADRERLAEADWTPLDPWIPGSLPDLAKIPTIPEMLGQRIAGR